MMTKDVFDCMRECHSVREFKEYDIPVSILARILEAGCWAPSAGNLQPWYFYVVKNQQVKNQLAEACFEQGQVKDSAVSIVILADPARSNASYGQRGVELYCIQDTAIAAENMILAAYGLGIDSCWVGGFDEVAVQKAVEAPPELRPVAIICLGYSDEPKAPAKERLKVAQVTKIIH